LPLRIESLGSRPAEQRPRAVAIGNFDGVHLGHLRLLGACVAAARSRGLTPAVLTFDPHPAAVVSQRGAPPRIQTLRSRKRMLTEAGIEELAHLRFDENTARLTPEEFVERFLVLGMRAACVVVGQGFRFGAGRAGSVETLRELGRGRFETVEVETLEDGAERVSSSRIREALLRGDLALAKRYLGRPYEIEGVVIHGDHRGRSLGFPTANLDLEGVSALRPGVYAADGIIEGEASPRRAAVNLGVRPTFGGEEPRLEAHFLGYDGDLYGKSVRLIFLERLRDERRFDSLEDLKAQLAADVKAAARAESSPASAQTG
jgi:riboflavin kinase/FMN adenylyltransferase